jgi:hypothetical protein
MNVNSYNWLVPSSLNTDFISGYTYNKLCKWSLCPRYEQKFDVNNLSENDFVFLNLDHFESFVNYLNLTKPEKKFILVTQNSDRDFSGQMFNSIKEYTSKILSVNCTVSNEMIVKIPLGFNDQSTEVLDTKDFTFVEKRNLIYMNFKLHHHSDRRVCYDYFKQFDWVDIESGIIPINYFYDKLNTFKYCISPRGTGIDTHRVYESLLFGVIPIIKKSELNDLYSKFPVIIVDNWSDVTYDFLINNYNENLSKYFKWKENNKDWYRSDFWIKK